MRPRGAVLTVALVELYFLRRTYVKGNPEETLGYFPNLSFTQEVLKILLIPLEWLAQFTTNTFCSIVGICIMSFVKAAMGICSSNAV